MKIAFELDLPEGAAEGSTQAELVRTIKEQTVLSLYSDDRVTTGEAAELLGLSRLQFLDLLRTSGVGFRVDLDDEDFRQIRQWREEHGPSKSAP